MQIPLKINQVYFCDIKRYVLFEIMYAENTGRNLSEIRPSLNIFALTIIFRHNWACPQGFWNICYLIGNVKNCLAILPPMKCGRDSRHCKNDSSTVHKWGKLKIKHKMVFMMKVLSTYVQLCISLTLAMIGGIIVM